MYICDVITQIDPEIGEDSEHVPKPPNDIGLGMAMKSKSLQPMPFGHLSVLRRLRMQGPAIETAFVWRVHQ